ncbi:hypothetical protein Avbf_15478 [Armadillidium vulgare]|nr:hypothetical protein Avbf_15478 [Armadillidium vulgare]
MVQVECWIDRMMEILNVEIVGEQTKLVEELFENLLEEEIVQRTNSLRKKRTGHRRKIPPEQL